jgi:hypothetical protein
VETISETALFFMRWYYSTASASLVGPRVRAVMDGRRGGGGGGGGGAGGGGGRGGAAGGGGFVWPPGPPPPPPPQITSRTRPDTRI